MPFKIIKQPKFTTRAKIVIPTDGAPLEQFVDVRFQYVEEAEALPVDDFLHKAVLDMMDLTDEAGHPVLFDDVRETLLTMPFMRVGLTRAYFEALAGAAAKN